MGKGDKRTKKGKIKRGSYGNSRKHKSQSTAVFSAPVKKTKKTAKVETTNAIEELVKSEAPAEKKTAAKATKKTTKKTDKTEDK